MVPLVNTEHLVVKAGVIFEICDDRQQRHLVNWNLSESHEFSP